ncbi:MAG: MazG nucleotide pyrophosphohydrolase domain-containing protein [Gemmatimonadaceae bacterium]
MPEPSSDRAPTFESYQRDASRTLNASLTPADQSLDAAAGLAEEAGEILALIRKDRFQGRALDREQLIAELGDALWCLTAVTTAMGLSLGDVAAANLAKLRARYPHGLGRTSSKDPAG